VHAGPASCAIRALASFAGLLTRHFGPSSRRRTTAVEDRLHAVRASTWDEMEGRLGCNTELQGFLDGTQHGVPEM
jgi:hypothetical protein